MNKLQLSQQSLNPFCRDIPTNKTKAKQNDSKHLNAIKPYIKQRKNSKRQIHPKNILPLSHEASRSKSRRNDSARYIDHSSINHKNLGDIYQELISLKAQYHSLKSSYNHILKQKQQALPKQSYKSMQELERAQKQIQKYKNNMIHQQHQIERIKRQCIKMIEVQKFKYRKLQETLQQKELMIAYLRSQIANLTGAPEQSNSQHFFFQNTAPIFNEHISKISQNNSIISSGALPEISEIPNQSSNKLDIRNKRRYQSQEDSLSFSRDKSKEQQSVHSTINNGENAVLTFTKKDVIILDSSGKNSSPGQEDCLTFENRTQNVEKIENLPLKVNTKRLLICTDEMSGSNKNCIKQGQSLQTRKKSCKQKKKTLKKKK